MAMSEDSARVIHAMGRDAWKRYEERLITLATGSLGLSIAFREHLVPQHPVLLWMLNACWISFVITITAGLLGLQAQSSMWLRMVRGVDEKPMEGLWMWTYAMSWLSFIIGILFLVWFAVANNH